KGDSVEQRRAVERAIASGVRYFDTAPSYGDGRSEENLGLVLTEIGAPAADLIVGTKFRLDAEEAGDASVAKRRIRESLEASLRRLQRDRVHLLQLHNRIVLESNASGGLSAEDVLGPVLEGLHAVQAAGLTEHIGFTGTGDTAAVRRILESAHYGSAQIFFNALNPSAGWAGHVSPGGHDFGGIIDVAAQHNTGVIVIRPLAAGAVTASADRHPNAGRPGGVAGEDYAQDLARAAAFQTLASRLGLESSVELALRFALTKTGVSTVLAGFSDISQVESAIRWAERGPLGPEAVQHVLSLRADVPQQQASASS
ncbi:MAG TPA: aldo/keto reductase, partial [Chloroflexota bacterium]|nr:aldo/keto reductase [Chloroflexota bacterium]